MNNFDRVYSFFNNEMTLDQEREFLISVASKDSLRREIKSQVLINTNIDEQVRSNIFNKLNQNHIVKLTGLKNKFNNYIFFSLIIISTFGFGYLAGNKSLINKSEISYKSKSPSVVTEVKSDINNNNQVQNIILSSLTKKNNFKPIFNYSKNKSKLSHKSNKNYVEQRMSNPLNPNNLLNYQITSSPLDPIRYIKPQGNYNKEYQTSDPLNPKTIKSINYKPSGTPLDPLNKGSQQIIPNNVNSGNELPK
jgi:hypothetical protein